MTEAELLNIVYTRIGGERKSGVLKPILLSYLPDAISSACRLIATHQPTGHQKALANLTQITAITVDDANPIYPSFTFPSNAIELDRFHRMVGQWQDGLLPIIYYDFQPVFNYHSLSLAGLHGLDYYYIENDKVFLAPKDGTTVVDSVDIRHYAYMTISEYPIELVDILVDELLKRIALNSFNDPDPKKRAK